VVDELGMNELVDRIKPAMLEDLEQLAGDLRVLGPVCHLGHLLVWGLAGRSRDPCVVI
jgi:hypothetical protein